MKKIFTLICSFSLFFLNGFTQVYIDENFDTEIPATWSTSSESDANPWTQMDDYTDFSGTYTLDGTGFVMVDSDDAGSGTVDLVENLDTPEFDASTGNIVIVKFDQYFNELGNDEVSVEVWNGTEWNTAWSFDGPNSLGSWDTPDEKTVIITDYISTGADTKVRFRYIDGGSWAWYWAIDNVVIESVDCLEPQDLAVDQLGAISTLVSWISGSGSSNFAYGPSGFDINDIAGTGGTLVSAATSPYTISGLDTETSYEFYVQDDCGVDGLSGWSGPFSFTTTVGCPDPFFSGFSNPTTNSIDISFTQGFGDIYFIYGPEGFILGDEGDTTGVVTSPFTLDNLDPLTFYDVYFYMDCNGDGLGLSNTIGNYTFNTLVDGPGTSCGDPIILNNNLPYNGDNETTCGYGDNIGISSCFGFALGEEIVYAYSPETDDEVIAISLNNIDGDYAFVAVMDACPDSAGASCIASGQSAFGASNLLLDNVDLIAGQIYYIFISSYNWTDCITMDVIISVVDCETPTELSAVSFSDGSADLSWTSNSSAPDFQIEWGIEGFELGTGTISDGEYGVDGPPFVINGLTSENNYEFYITDVCGFGSISLPAGPYVFSGPPPANDLCADAIEISCGDVLTGNTSAATTTGNPVDLCGTGLTAPSVWYTFVGTGDGVELDLCGSDYDTKIHLFSGDCDDLVCVGGNDDNFGGCPSSGLNSYLYANTEVGVTYYVIVSGFSANTGIYSLEYTCITCPLLSGLTASASDVAATVSWDDANIGATFIFEYGAAGFVQGTGTIITGIVGTDGPPVELTDLTAGDTYDFYVYEVCVEGDSNSTQSGSVTTNLLPPPANDLACDAIELTEGAILETTNIYAATEANEPVPPATGCQDPNQMGWCISSIASTTWYTYTPTSSGIATISTCHPGSYDTQLAVYEVGDCADFSTYTLVAANDDQIGGCTDATFASTVNACVQAGNTYYVQVDPYGNQGAAFSISVDFEEGSSFGGVQVFEGTDNVSITFDYSSPTGDVDFTIIYLNLETGDTASVTGNTGNLPIVIDGIDPNEEYEFYIYLEDNCYLANGPYYFMIVNSISELNFDANIHVYPNPVRNMLTIEIESELESGTRISIVNLQGQLIYTESISVNVSEYKTEIDVASYSKGIYMLKIDNNEASIQKRIIVQ